MSIFLWQQYSLKKVALQKCILNVILFFQLDTLQSVGYNLIGVRLVKLHDIKWIQPK